MIDTVNIKLITPPVAEPVTLESVKLYARIDSDIEDTLVSGWITAGRVLCEDFIRCSLMTQTWELTLEAFDDKIIQMPRGPIQALTSVKYYDYESTEFVFDTSKLIIDLDSTPGRLLLAYNQVWPSDTLREIGAVKIRYVAGYPSADLVPSVIKDAIYLYCAFRNDNREGELDLPKQVHDLIRPYRLYL